MAVKGESDDAIEEEVEAERSCEKFDAFGAMDLSSSCSSSVHGEEEKEVENSNKSESHFNRKRKAERLMETKDTFDKEAPETLKNDDISLKGRSKRRNIKKVLDESDLNSDTKAAHEEESLRLNRLRENRKMILEVRVGGIYYVT